MEDKELTGENTIKKSKFKNKTIFACIGSFLLIAVFLVVYFQNLQGKDSIEESEFNVMDDLVFSVVDDSYFEEEDMEKWYLEKRQEPGEHIYAKGEQTYVLLSLGVVDNPNTFLLLHGVKQSENGELMVGYDQIVVETETNLELQDDIRSTLIVVEGNYKNVEAVKVEESTDIEES